MKTQWDPWRYHDEYQETLAHWLEEKTPETNSTHQTQREGEGKSRYLSTYQCRLFYDTVEKKFSHEIT